MKVIAISGGPCAGKTSAVDVLRERLEDVGVSAVFVPEAATDLIQSGIAPWTCSSMLEFQTRVIALQLEREAEAFEQAAADKADIVICDRGICDSHAYLTDEEYARALEANDIDSAAALSRYDAVFHLESIAKGNPEKYTQANNSARFESAEEAAIVDDRGIEAWSEHPRLRIVKNRDSFDEKVGDLFESMHAMVYGTSKCIIVSACLLGEPCRYDGKSVPCEAVIKMARTHEIIAVCPEVLGGLPTPRTPCEIQPDGQVIDAEGRDRTAAFEAGARAALRIAQEHGCRQAILKENSPSCGSNHVYDGAFSGTLAPGKGKTAALLEEAGIEVRAEDSFR